MTEKSKTREGYGLASSLKKTVSFIPKYTGKVLKELEGGTYFPTCPLSQMSGRFWSSVFARENILGLHGAVASNEAKPEIKLLGGYELDEGALPDTKQDLVVGATPQSNYEGRMGRIAVMSPESITDTLSKTLKAIAQYPSDIPSTISRNDVGLWIGDSHQDESKSPHKLLPVRVRLAPE